MKTTIIISNESQEVTSEAIYMLLNARKLLFILTPLLTLLITIGTIYLIHHLNLYHQNQNQNQNQNQHQHLQQQRIVGSRQISRNSSNSSQRHNQQEPASRGEQHQLQGNSLPPSVLANHHSNHSSNSEKLVKSGELATSLLLEEQLNSRQRHSRHEPKAMKPNRDGQTGLIQIGKLNNNGTKLDVNVTTETVVNINRVASSYSTREEKSSQTTISTTIEKQQQVKTNLKSQEQNSNNDNDNLKRTNFDIVLDRGNFVLSSRCSNDRIYIKVNKRTKMPVISTSPQNLFKNNSRQKDAAKIKILSSVFTIESVTMPLLNSVNNLDANNDYYNHNKSDNVTTKRTTYLQVPADDSAIKTINTDSEGGEDEESLLKGMGIGDHRNQVKSSLKQLLSTSDEHKEEAGVQRADEPLLSLARDIGFTLNRSPVVRLRANLTQLYICFSLDGKLEARVSISLGRKESISL